LPRSDRDGGWCDRLQVSPTLTKGHRPQERDKEHHSRSDHVVRRLLPLLGRRAADNVPASRFGTAESSAAPPESEIGLDVIVCTVACYDQIWVPIDNSYGEVVELPLHCKRRRVRSYE